jgi:hypothetical protein
MLQQLLEILQAEAKVFCDPPELSVGEFDPIVVGECDGPVANPKNHMRSTLSQLDEPLLEREPDLASLWHCASISPQSLRQRKG